MLMILQWKAGPDRLALLTWSTMLIEYERRGLSDIHAHVR